MRFIAIFFAFVFCVAATTTEGLADGQNTCKLIRVAALDMNPLPNGMIRIPVEVSGKTVLFLLDTGAPNSILSPDVANALNLAVRDVAEGQVVNSSGHWISSSTKIDQFGIGGMRAYGVRVFVSSEKLDADGGFGGILGTDVLSNYDVELDFKAGKVYFYSQDHCPGQVVSWQASAIAVIPIALSSGKHIELTVDLEDKPLRALLDTGASHTFLYEDVARDLFDLKLGGADTPVVDGSVGSKDAMYEHRFGSLALEGIRMSKVPVQIIYDKAKDKILDTPRVGSRMGSLSSWGGISQIILGIHELRNLHLYIAYKEHMIYATPA